MSDQREREAVEKAAREIYPCQGQECNRETVWCPGCNHASILVDFALSQRAEAREEQRELCAKIARNWRDDGSRPWIAEQIASAIRQGKGDD